MAVSDISSSSLPANLSSSSKSAPAEELSAVQKVLAQKKTEDSKIQNFFKSETYFKGKANQLKYMMAVYSNLGLNEEYRAIEAEAIKVVKEYTKLYGTPKTTTSTTA